MIKERTKFVLEWEKRWDEGEGRLNFAQLCREFGVAPRTAPFANCTEPNAVWCIDFKGWFRTQDGKKCYPLTITDAYSRLVIRCEALSDPRGSEVKHDRIEPGKPQQNGRHDPRSSSPYVHI